MAYSDFRNAVSRSPSMLVECDFDRCQNTYGVNPCTATGGQCHYTFPTCEDPANYVRGTRAEKYSQYDGPALSVRYGERINPYLNSVTYIPTEIDPERSKTNVARITFNMQEDYAPLFLMDHDKGAGKFSTSTDGAYWRNLIVRSRNYRRRPVRYKRGFFDAGFPLVDYETIWKGVLDSINLNADGTVDVVAKDGTKLFETKVPNRVSDDNLLDGAITSTDDAIVVDDGTQITDPGTLVSRDHWPVVLKIGAEYIALKSLVSNTATVQDNYLKSTEDFDDAAWVKTNLTVTANQYGSPFDGSDASADLLTPTGAGGEATQASTVVAASATHVASVWLRADVPHTTRIRIHDQGNTEGTNADVAVTIYWQRFQVSRAFSGGAVGNVHLKVYADYASDTDTVHAWGTQAESGSTAGNYVPVGTGGTGSSYAGRGFHGSTPAAHADNASFSEVIRYARHDDSTQGVNPIAIMLDLVTRAGIPASDLDLAGWWDEREIQIPAVQFLREIDEPGKIDDFMKELRRDTMADIWFGEDLLLHIRIYTPIERNVSLKAIGDGANIVRGSFVHDDNQTSRVSRALVRFNWDGEGDEDSDYPDVRGSVNASSESSDDYGEIALKLIKSRWIPLSSASYALQLASRYVFRFRNPAKLIEFDTELKDDDLETGNNALLSTAQLTDTDGSPWSGKRVYVLSKRQVSPNRLRFKVMDVSVTRRYAIIGPNTMASTYQTATDADKAYGYIGDNNGQVGTPKVDGYYVF